MSTTSDTSDRVPAGAPAGRRAVRRIAMLVAATAALAISAVAPGTALGRDTGAGSPAGTVRDFRTALWAARLRLAGRLIDQESAVKGLAYRAEQRGPRAWVTVSAAGASLTFRLPRATATGRNEFQAPPTRWRIDSGVERLVAR